MAGKRANTYTASPHIAFSTQSNGQFPEDNGFGLGWTLSAQFSHPLHAQNDMGWL